MEKRSIEDDFINILDRSSTWMDAIFAYLVDDTLLDSYVEKLAVKKWATGFVIMGGQLFKMSFHRPYWKCVTPEKGNDVLDDLHQGFCGLHIGGKALAKKAVRQGYFWPTMQADAMSMVRRCDKCQRFAKLIHRPATDLTAIHSPVPFAKWDMDILGLYTPATGQRWYMFVAIDYFTK